MYLQTVCMGQAAALQHGFCTCIPRDINSFQASCWLPKNVQVQDGDIPKHFLLRELCRKPMRGAKTRFVAASWSKSA